MLRLIVAPLFFGQPLRVIWFHLDSLIFLLISHIKDLTTHQSSKQGEDGQSNGTD